MNRTVGVVLLLLAMIAIIVTVDVLFLRDRFWLRLLTNVGVVALAGIIYAKFLRD